MAGAMHLSPEPRSVAVGVDGSPSARTAALWAGAEAARRDSTLHIFHGADTADRIFYLTADIIEDIHVAGHELLEATALAVSKRFPGLDVTTQYSRRDPVYGLRRLAEKYSMIVVGHRGLGGFESLRLGSVGLKTATGATTPVVVVRGTANAQAQDSVLAAVRDEHDIDCARQAASEAELRKASLRLLTVWDIFQYTGTVVTMLDDVGEVAGRRLRSLETVADRVRKEYPGLALNVDAEKSVSVAGALVEASRTADLLVVRGRRSPGHIGPALGHTAHSLLHHAHCPVELIPRHDEDEGSEAP
ncbi:universal stress protein [Streptomyces sp. NPDC006691]|uniref:universal stress protein n=1 Tax=Streptomyces sp. NPDC006691 TaxID=3364757 RepID=UPI0036766BEB